MPATGRALQLEVVPAAALDGATRAEILAVCSDAYEEEFSAYLELLAGAVHVLGRHDGALVAHAAWVERPLYAGNLVAPLRAAYVEAVAVPTALQGRGHGTQVLAALPPLLEDYDIAALSPSEAGFYARLGWETWRGALWYRDGDAEVPTPEEEIMILRLPKTPTTLDLSARLGIDWRPLEVW
jgi:GNAT superfamily N-acetyltransferase